MSATAICPTCETPVLGSVCRLCAFSSALAGISALSTDDESSPVAPETPEGYELLKELGRGASAVVWLARERKLERLIALKLISVGADRRLMQRLVREGQAVARLRHPHIVVVHAMGATETQAFLAMDFVAGGDLRQRLAGRSLVPADAARLVRKLADALAHAHQHEILHRDIKPSNVLLDANGEPHLADFGLAAPLEGGGDLTLPGQVAGTPAYLAPELLTGADRASPLSDLYSLGALLYECLTGRAPFVGDSAPAILAQASTAEPPAPRLLQPGIARDLETICLKCLHKMSERRYASAAALRNDLDRFLGGEPIAARPVSRGEKGVRWCRRHPGTTIFAGVAASLLLTLAIGGPLMALRLARARAHAATEAATSKAVSEFLQNDLLAQASPNNQPDRDLKLRTVLDRAAKNIEGRFAHQPLVEASVRTTLGATYKSLGEFKLAQTQTDRVLLLYRTQLGEEAPETLNAMSELASLLMHQGDYAKAETLARRTALLMGRILGAEHRSTLECMSIVGNSCLFQGKLAEAETIIRDGLATCRRLFGPEDPATLSSMSLLAVTYRRLDKLPEAAALNIQLAESYRHTLGPEHPKTLGTLSNLAVIYQFQDKFAEAEVVQRQVLDIRKRVLGPEHPDTIILMGVLAASYQFQGKLVEAEALHLEVLELKKRILGAGNPSVLTTMNNLALTYQSAGKFAEAERLGLQLLALKIAKFGPESPEILAAMNNLAVAHRRLGKLAEAETLHQKAWEIEKRAFGPEHVDTLQSMSSLGLVFLDQKRFDEAAVMLRRCLELREKSAPGEWRTHANRSELGEALTELKQFAAAEPLLLAGHDGLKKLIDKIPVVQRWELSKAATRLSRFYVASGQTAKAEEWQKMIAENVAAAK